MTQLSEHFALEEFLRSETAARMGRPITIDDDAIRNNLARWCELIGEPLRAKLGRPITILSGYRPPWLNAAVGGAKNSAHMQGCAADIIVPGMSVPAVCRAVGSSALPFDQLILEFGQWTHIGIAAVGAEARAQQLTAMSEDGETIYRPGIQFA